MAENYQKHIHNYEGIEQENFKNHKFEGLLCKPEKLSLHSFHFILFCLQTFIEGFMFHMKWNKHVPIFLSNQI